MAESNKMKDMPVNKLMVQMGILMILSMDLFGLANFWVTNVTFRDIIKNI